MVGSFACPECGRELEVEGLAPGGLIQCGDCTTWVEIPFLPRAAATQRWRRTRKRSPWERKALRLGLGLLGFALVAAAASRMIGGQLRADRERVLNQLIAAADEAEAAGRSDRALIELEAAVARARATGSARLPALQTRRAAASLREAKTRLAAVAALDPDRAVGEILTLRDRAKLDHALDPLAESIHETLATQTLRRAQADLDLARSALEAGRGGDAFTVAAKLHDRAGQLEATQASRIRTEAEALMGAAVARFGVVLAAVKGRFVLGSPDGYSSRLDGPWAEALRPKGYLPQPRRSLWRGLWDEKAPFRAVVTIAETPGGPYLQSRNLTTDIDGDLRFEHRDRMVWQNRVVITSDTFPAQLSVSGRGSAAASNHRDPEVERRLHDAALTQFVERASRKMGGLPSLADALRGP